jgi:hypothetical protein
MFARWLTNPAAAAQPTISEVMSVMLLSLPLLPLLPFLLSLPLLSLSLFNVGMGRPAVTRTDAKKRSRLSSRAFLIQLRSNKTNWE